MKQLLLFFSLLLITPSLTKAQDMELDGNLATFYYKPNNSTLYANYQDNRYALMWINTIIPQNIDEILSGSAHLNIYGFVKRQDINNNNAINTASIQGSVLRAYLKTNYNIPHSAVTFAIDTTQNRNNIVMLQLSHEPIKAYKNTQISYSLKDTYMWIDQAVAKYNYGVPYTSLYMQLAKENINFANNENFYKLEDGAWVAEDFANNEELIAEAVQEEINSTQTSQETITKEPEVLSTIITPKEEESKKVFGFKTNLPYWVAALPNLEVEFYLGNVVSIAAEGHYTYLNGVLDNNQIYRATGGSAELRFWFKADGKFTGVYAGFYGSKGFYDVKLDLLGMTGNQCDYFSAGLSLGYVHKISKSFFLELGLAGGYIDFTNIKYTLDSQGAKIPDADQASIDGWGILPTKAKIALMWRF